MIELLYQPVVIDDELPEKIKKESDTQEQVKKESELPEKIKEGGARTVNPYISTMSVLCISILLILVIVLIVILFYRGDIFIGDNIAKV